MGSSCPHFRIGKLLAKEAGLSENRIHTYIEFFNRHVRSLTDPRKPKPIDDAFYESLPEEKKAMYIKAYAKILYSFIQQTTSERIDNAESIDELRQELGSKAAFAQMAVLQAFSPEARESFRCEFNFLLRKLASEYGSVEEMLDTNNISVILKKIKKNYTLWAAYHRKRFNDMSNDPNTPEEELAYQEELMNESANIVEFFAELCIVNNAEMKKLFGRSFNPESNTLFVEDDESNIHTDEEVDIDMEEEERERWQVIMDSIDPSGTLSSIINNIISQCPVRSSRMVEKKGEDGKTIWVEEPTIYKYTRICQYKAEDGTYKRIPMTVNTRVEARRLLRTLRSCVTSEDMMARLEENYKYVDLAAHLRANPRLRTTFFVNFNKYYMHYYSTKTSGSSMSEIHLNASGNFNRVRSFLYMLSGNRSTLADNASESIFTFNEKSSGIVFNPDNIIKFVRNYTTFVEQGYDENGRLVKQTIEDFINNKTTNQQVAALELLLQHLNIRISLSDLRVIVSDSIVLRELLNSLNNLRSFLNGQKKSSKSAINIFEELKSGGERNYGFTALTKILEITDSVDEFGAGLSGMVSYKGSKTKTLSANIMMSQMTRFIKECNYASAEDLKRIIAETYMNDSSLYDAKKGKFRVKWLQDLYESADHKGKRAFRKKFKMSRNLGLDTVDAENLSDKGHALTMLSMYFNNLSTNNNVIFVDSKDEIESLKEKIEDTYVYVRGSNEAVYVGSKFETRDEERSRTIVIPTFITADTLAIRGITSLHYDTKEIISGIFDFLMADMISSRKADKFNEMGLPVSGNGSENFTKNPSRFGFCGFLNPSYVGKVKVVDETAEDGTVIKYHWELKKGYWNERFQKVKGSYDEATISPIIKEWMESEFEYFYDVHLPSLGITEESFDLTGKGVGETRKDKLRDFYYNYRFSQMNQTAIIDLSPNFFKNAEEHQKRNKVAYTNGTQLCIDAIDPKTGQPVWDNPKNPTQKVVYIYDIKPTLSEHDRKMLRSIFGEDSDYDYESVYEENTISDGQGWRSFTSWRKIGLSFDSKVWSDQMEDAYWKIQELSKEIYALEDALESWEANHKEFKLHSGSLEELKAEKEAAERNNEGDIIKEKIASKIAEIEKLAVVFQPRKPVCNGIEQYKDIAVPFQHKYAEIPVIPALFPKNSALRTLGRFMEEHNIDMFCSDKCGKKGVFGEIDIQHKVNELGQYVDADGDVIPGLDANGNEVSNPTKGEQRRHPEFKNAVENTGEEVISLQDMLSRQIGLNDLGSAVNDETDRVFNGVIHENPLRTYLIQTNVPDHSVADTIFGNQLRKIILGGINPDSVYQYRLGGRDVTITGEQLTTLYNALISANLFRSFSEFERLISDDKRVLKELAKNILNNDRSDLSSIDRMARGLPFWDPLLQHDAFASLISMFKSIVGRQLINGGSVVQASSLGANMTLDYLDDGLEFKTDPETGLPVECEAVMPFAFEVIDEFGDSHALEFDDYCNADGTFKTDEHGNTLIENDYPGILDVIAYRVPTEREYSILKLKIKKCCPKTGGNFIQLPSICTTRAGFDFDIDKLLLMRRVFNASKTTFDVEKVWSRVYANHPNIEDALQKARSVATSDEKEVIKQDYEKRGEEIPEDDEIPLNRFWKVAVNRGYITEDKRKIFREAAEGFREAVIEEHYTELDAFDEDGNLSLEKIFSGKVSKSDIDNLLLDIIQARMSDPETAEARFTAGGFVNTSLDSDFIRYIESLNSNNPQVDKSKKTVNLSNMSRSQIRDMKGIEKEDQLFDDPMTSIRFYQLNRAAAALIGVFANSSSNYFIQKRVKAVRNNGPAILFGSHIVSEGGIYKGKFADSGVNMLMSTNAEGDLTVSQILAELLAASVDAVKNPILKYLNLSLVTADAAAVLARMGYDTRDIGLLFNQPIIKEITSLMEREGISSVNTAMTRVLANHNMPKIGKLVGKKGKPVDLSKLTRESLAYNLIEDSEFDNYSQEQVIKVFYNLMKVKDSYTKKVQESRKTSLNATKTNVGSYKADLDRRNADDDLITIEVHDDYEGPVIPEDDSPVQSMTERLDYFRKYEFHPYAFEVVMSNLISRMFNDLIDKHTPYDQRTFRTIEDAAKTWCHYGTINADTYNELYEEIPRLIFKNMDGDLNPEYVNPDKTINPDGLTNFDLYVKGLQEMIDNLSQEDDAIFRDTTAFRKNIFKPRTIRIEVNSKMQSFTVYDLSPGFSADKSTKEDIYASWQNMAEKSEDLAQLAKAIFLHLYYLNGLQQSSSFDFRSVPTNVLANTIVSGSHNMNYMAFMNELVYEDGEDNPARMVLDANMINPYSILGEFIRQHSDNTRFVYKVTNAVRESFIFQDSDIVTISSEDSHMLTHTVNRGGQKITMAVPYINIDGQLYELSSFKGGLNLDSCKVSKRPTLMYTAVKSTVDSKYSDFITKDSSSKYVYGVANSVYGMSIFEDSFTSEVESEDEESTTYEDSMEDAEKNPSEAAKKTC